MGGFKGKSIAYIPTVSNNEGWGNWKDGGFWKLVQTLGADIALVQLVTATIAVKSLGK